MATILLGAAVVVACSALAGQGICTLAGRDRWEWWAPGVGFAWLLVIAGVLIRAPGHAKTAALGIAIATLAPLASRRTRSAIVSALPDAIPVAGFSLLASLLPFVVNGRAGIIGAGMNNDSGAHLGTAWWLIHAQGPQPVGALGGPLVESGYPIGPHGIFAALSLDRIALVHTFDAMVVAALPLTALVALGALRGAPRLMRWIAAILVGFCYLGVSFTVQASFKETIEALLVIATVLATRDVCATPRLGLLSGVPVGLLIGASVWVYSYGGLLWTSTAAVAVALTSGQLRRALRAVPGALLAAAVTIAPALPAILDFRSSPFNHESGEGNLLHALNPVEGLGVWLNYDFRWTPDPLWPTILLAAVAGLAAIVAIVRLVRAHELALPAALVPILATYAYVNGEKSIYLSAKTLAIASPLVALTIAAGLLRPVAPGRRAGLVGLGLAGLAAVFAFGAGLSSFWALRDGRVGPEGHAAELSALKPKIHGSVLYMGKDDLAQWELVGLDMYQGRGFYAPRYVHARPSKPNVAGGFFDFDSFLPSTLDRFRYAITTRTPYQSHAPRNWKVVARTPSYTLWRRHGATPYRIPADFYNQPMRRLHCASEFGRSRLGGARNGFALRRAAPVIGRAPLWRGQTFKAGQSASMTLRVPRGRWDLSMAYGSMTGLDVRAGNLRAAMPATIDRIGAPYLVGTLVQRRSGPLTVHVTAKRANAFARLIGAPVRTRGLDMPSHKPLGNVALTRHGERPRAVKPLAACGHWIDYVQPPGRAGRP